MSSNTNPMTDLIDSWRIITIGDETMKQISNFDQITSKFEDRTQKSFFLRHYEENSISETISKQILHLVYYTVDWRNDFWVCPFPIKRSTTPSKFSVLLMPPQLELGAARLTFVRHWYGLTDIQITMAQISLRDTSNKLQSLHQIQHKGHA